MKYTCPMHPEVKQDNPGNCPKCGMRLVLETEVASQNPDNGLGKNTWKSYTPLFVIASLIFTSSLAISFPLFDPKIIISAFMVGFFLVFAGFKLIDLKGFAEGYSTYDLLAKRWPTYGYVYPFIELAFGLGMIVFPFSRTILIVELLIMSFSGLGVAIKLAKREKFQCVCLGTFLKVPLTKVTLIEDFGMALLSFLLLSFGIMG